MAISSTHNKKVYLCDGNTTVFPYDFLIFDEQHLEVYKYEIATGNQTKLTLNTDYTQTKLTLNTDYTVSGVNNPSGGNVTLLIDAPSSDYKLIILRNVPMTQETDYIANDPFPAESHEKGLDKLTMLVQQLSEKITRSILRDITQSESLTFPLLQAGKFLRSPDGNTLDFATPSAVDYPGEFNMGLDANKPASPSRLRETGAKLPMMN